MLYFYNLFVRHQSGADSKWQKPENPTHILEILQVGRAIQEQTIVDGPGRPFGL